MGFLLGRMHARAKEFTANRRQLSRRIAGPRQAKDLASHDGIVYVGASITTDLGETYEDRRKLADGQLEVTVTSDGDTVPTIAATDLASTDLAAITSVTVAGPGKAPGLLARLKEGAANPTEFDRNGDGTVTNLELFPKAPEGAPPQAIDPFSRPLPKPVANVTTEGTEK